MEEFSELVASFAKVSFNNYFVIVFDVGGDDLAFKPLECRVVCIDGDGFLRGALACSGCDEKVAGHELFYGEERSFAQSLGGDPLFREGDAVG